MTGLFVLFLLWSPSAPGSLASVRAEPNAERRARFAIDYATVAESKAEEAYTNGDPGTTSAELKNVEASLEVARQSLVASGKTPGRNLGPYKYAEMRSHKLLVRLGDLERKMELSQRNVIAGVKTKVQEIHDAWFEGIMGRTN